MGAARGAAFVRTARLVRERPARGAQRGGPVSLRRCGNGRATSWAAWPDGTLRGAGRCLAVTGAANSPVRVAPCNGAASEQWQLLTGQVGAQLVSPSRGLCLADARDQRATGAHLVLGPCTVADPGTSWRLG